MSSSANRWRFDEAIEWLTRAPIVPLSRPLVYTRGQRAAVVGFRQRCVHEHADDLWIVATHTTSNEARILEYTLSLRYGIPTLPFVARKGGSTGGYVHDQEILSRIFVSIDTEAAVLKLMREYSLSREHPHHRAQTRDGNRKTVIVTLCGDKRGKTPMHRIAIAGNDAAGRKALEAKGFSVRGTGKNSSSWRFESAHKEYGKLLERVHEIQHAFPGAIIIQNARLGGKKKNPKDGNSLPCTAASSVKPGMALFDETGGYDVVATVAQVEKMDYVYDLNIEHTHNFIANGIVTHNCIYSWRGAEIEHLNSFDSTFRGAKTVLLEQNYRSTRTILTAANNVISKNVRRKEKNLFTEKETGEPIIVYGGRNEMDEAWFVASSITNLLEEGTAPGEIAVLYRENFQSRALEEALLHNDVPYRVLGVRFFERAEVKDVLSYLRASLNPKSKQDVGRIIAVPPRGIGKTTLEKIFAGVELTGAARDKVAAFSQTLAKIKLAAETLPASEAVRFAFEASGIERMLKADTEEGEERIQNVRELVNLATRFDDVHSEESPTEGIERLLEEAALQSEQDTLNDVRSAVSLMTVHASKGLEFDAVFVTGLEQGLFPSIRDDTRDPEEERRLFYVALTRARKRLFLSHARERMKYGSREFTLPSEFLQDIDQRLWTTPHIKRGLLEDTIE